MFDISFVEIALVLVIALMVLGPERLPRAAKMVGLWVRRAKASWYSVKAEFERELADDELKRSLQEAQRDIAEARKDFEAATREPVKAIDELGKTAGDAAPDVGTGLAAPADAEPVPTDGDRPPEAAPGPAAPDDDVAADASTPDNRDEAPR